MKDKHYAKETTLNLQPNEIRLGDSVTENENKIQKLNLNESGKKINPSSVTNQHPITSYSLNHYTRHMASERGLKNIKKYKNPGCKQK